MKVVIMLMALMMSITAHSNGKVTVTLNGNECSHICKMMEYKITKALKEAQDYILVAGSDVSLRYRYKTSQLVVIVDDRKEAEVAHSTMTHVRKILLANDVLNSSFAILSVDGSERNAMATTITRIDDKLVKVYSSRRWIGYGSKMANSMHYCYYHWSNPGLLSKSYNSYEECLKDI